MSLCLWLGSRLTSNRKVIKVAGSSLLIHAIACSLFFGIYSVISNMTGYFHSCHSIKLIHWGAPERDVLGDKIVLRVVTQIFYFMLRQSSILSTLMSFVYKDKWWFDERMSVTFCMESTEKKNSFIPSSYQLFTELNLKTWLCN